MGGSDIAPLNRDFVYVQSGFPMGYWSHHFGHTWWHYSLYHSYLYGVVAIFKSAYPKAEDAELGDDDSDHDGEGDGGVAVVLQEGHQEAKAGKEHDMDVDDHWGNKLTIYYWQDSFHCYFFGYLDTGQGLLQAPHS